MTVKLWLRAETKAGESRSALSPNIAATLLSRGLQLTVEESSQSAIPSESFAAAGCQLAAAGSWREAPSETYILGLKELPDDGSVLKHRHIYFAHAYKEQSGWQQLLRRFQAGGGELLDLEYLVDETGRRVAAFGYWAGFAGTALALMTWSGQQLGRHPPLPTITTWPDKRRLLEDVQALYRSASGHGTNTPRLIVLGAKGRVGSGALALAQELDLEVSPWDIEETANGGPFAEILSHDLLVNCVLVNRPLPPFITRQLLARDNRQLRVIADISCDPYGQYNPIPLYSRCTDFQTPTQRLLSKPIPLDLIAIDNLPSMLPVESSMDFSEQLLPALSQLDDPNSRLWRRARTVFHGACAHLEEN